MKNFDLSKINIKSICEVNGYTLPESSFGSSKTAHNALIIRRSGKSTYKVGSRILTADSNNIVFLPCGTEYYMEVDSKGQSIVIEFDINNDYNNMSCGEYFFNNARDIISRAKNILHYWTLKGPAFEAKCLSELYSVITQISTLDLHTNTLAGKYRIIHSSIGYIEENYANSDLYTTELAELSGIGETYYRNIFISVFGMPPAKYIQQYRVDKAKALLVGTQKNIEEIARLVGFANSSYFCKVFKSITGMTPMDFSEKKRTLG